MKNKGITLIALVVTIVVLLILATVSIQMIGGENGIIKQANKSKTNKLSKGDNSAITSNELQKEINKYTKEAMVTGTGILIVDMKRTGMLEEHCQK